MAQSKLIFACLFLAVIFYQEIQFIERRHSKLERQVQFPKLQTYSKILEKETRKLAGRNSELEYTTVKAANADESPPTATSEEVAFPLPPMQEGDFRPTVPGHSPVAGHCIQN